MELNTKCILIQPFQCPQASPFLAMVYCKDVDKNILMGKGKGGEVGWGEGREDIVNAAKSIIGMTPKLSGIDLSYPSCPLLLPLPHPHKIVLSVRRIPYQFCLSCDINKV